jgi:PLAT/LH2 domain.
MNWSRDPSGKDFLFANATIRNLVYFLFLTGELKSIKLHRDNAGFNDSWFVEHIVIEHKDEGESHFPLSRWIPANQPMHFDKYDSQLPQFVKKNHPDLYKQRSEELDRKKKDFAYTTIEGVEGMPRTVSTL